jgi:hypothetical protein
LHDCGREFDNSLLNELSAILGVVKLKSSGYRPQTNGVCESSHKVLNTLLAKTISENQRDWSEHVKYVTFCYNATPHSATGFAPHFLMTGQDARWNIDFVLNCVNESDKTVPEYAADVLQRLNKAFEVTRENLKRSAEAMSTWYNRRSKPLEFTVGDSVRVYNPRRFKGRSPKWQSFYKEVAVVEKKLNDATYVVKFPRSGKKTYCSC